MNETDTFNVLRYLPIEISAEYFLSLPDSVINEMFEWFRLQGRNVSGQPRTSKREKAAYIFCSIWVQQPGNDAHKKMISQLEYYIRNSV